MASPHCQSPKANSSVLVTFGYKFDLLTITEKKRVFTHSLFFLTQPQNRCQLLVRSVTDLGEISMRIKPVTVFYFRHDIIPWDAFSCFEIFLRFIEVVHSLIPC